jgi:hypothetical protein
VRVVTFRLGQQRDPRDETERAAEVVKPELAGQATGVALPARDLAGEPGDLRLWERWRPRRVLLAVLVDKLGNGLTVKARLGPHQPSAHETDWHGHISRRLSTASRGVKQTRPGRRREFPEESSR